MAIKFYNTLSRKKEIFKAISPKKAGIYTCGPTVYDYAHIGNFRAYVFADILRRYLEYRGYKVRQVMNITDVDDKTIKGSQQQGIRLKEHTEKYTKAFLEDIKTMNIVPATAYPRATEHVKEMVGLIKILLKKGYAYKTKDGIYYKISKFRDYGKLAGLDLKGLKAGARVKVDDYSKENLSDFALWKFWDPADGNIYWETEFGKGRPGWHIECSAMSMKYLGKTIDIHSGGVDLIFPHHQNEIAQSEAATGKRFVNCWMHNEHLLVNGQKMSKSLGNFYTLRDVLKMGYSPVAVRYLLLSTHYRERLNFTFDGLEAAKNTVEKISNFMKNVKNGEDNKKTAAAIKRVRSEFARHMDNDLSISEALKAVFEFINTVNRVGGGKKAYETMVGFDGVLGLGLGKIEVFSEKIKINGRDFEIESDMLVSEDVKVKIGEREEFRAKKEWKMADSIRNRLKGMGFVLEDMENGVRVKKIQ
jgi:cysteinyl-tRNA synthetase